MRTIIKAGATAVFVSFITVSEAFAWCGLTGDCGLTPATTEPVATPEFDGPGAVAAIALLVSIAAVIYQRVRK